MLIALDENRSEEKEKEQTLQLYECYMKVASSKTSFIVSSVLPTAEVLSSFRSLKVAE
jgi:hypothetical protein